MDTAAALANPEIQALIQAQVAAAVTAALGAEKKTRKNPTIAEIFDWYFANCEAREIASVQSVRSHAKPLLKAFGKLKIDEFNEDVEDRMLRYRIERNTVGKVKDTTINREVRNLKAALNHAQRKQKIDATQNLWLPKPPQGDPRDRVLSHEAGGELFRYARELDRPPTPRHFAYFGKLALSTGQRKSSILQLRREHIDLERGVIWFSKTQKRKTKKKRQDQPINDYLRAVLVDAIGSMHPDCDAVIQFRGKPVRDVRTAHQAVLKRAGIAHCTIHDLRRTAAQTLRDRTDNLGMTAKFIGDKEGMIDSTYARPRVEQNKDAVDLLTGLLSEAAAA